jgi:pyruvate, water dikinase
VATVRPAEKRLESKAKEAGPAEMIRPFTRLSRADVPFAGGKGANLGEMTKAGLPVPPGFVIGAPAYAHFCAEGNLRSRLDAILGSVDVDDRETLDQVTGDARRAVSAEPVPDSLRQSIARAYEELCAGEGDVAVAVRSSATAEDTESASFAGMNETFLNVHGADAVIDAVRACWASLFGARTVFYRAKRGFGQTDMDIAVVVQRQIPSTRSGVMFTINPATGARDELVIEGSLGLGEAVVAGQVSPDRYVVDKETLSIKERSIGRKELSIESASGGGTVTRQIRPEEAKHAALNDREVHEIAELGVRTERHYRSPQDTEWAFDPEGRIWMLQSRPVTSAGGESTAPATGDGHVLIRGLGAAPGAASGPVRVIAELASAGELHDRDVLVTHMTAPDWVPLMRRAAAIVTDSGGMTCHAAIVSRELGIPCIAGTGDATKRLRHGEVVTVDATSGEVREGAMRAPSTDGAVSATPATAVPAAPVTGTKLLVNLSEPSQVERASALDVEGVGLLRAELMVLEALDGRHPRLLIEGGNQGELSTGWRNRSPSSRRRSLHGRSPIGRSISARTSSGASREVTVSSLRKRTR